MSPCNVIRITLVAFLAMAATVVRAELPSFVNEPVKPTLRGSIEAFRSADNVDVVFIDGGLDKGFRVGMDLDVVRGEAVLARLVLVDVRLDKAAALITHIQDDAALTTGDTVLLRPFNIIERR